MYAFYWLGLSIILFIIEAVSINLITIWFGIGALVSTFIAMITDNLVVHIVVFLAVSAVTLALTRPLLVKRIKKVPTNADSIIGKVAVVTKEIDNINAVGEVKADGKYWTARSADGSIIAEGIKVKVDAIEGVKLIVLPADV